MFKNNHPNIHTDLNLDLFQTHTHGHITTPWLSSLASSPTSLFPVTNRPEIWRRRCRQRRTGRGRRR
uniref:Uncharacterized protein n=1 Tax=Helianthus annuus TaxID=4232 RepID=A0A251UA00_HELAN